MIHHVSRIANRCCRSLPVLLVAAAAVVLPRGPAARAQQFRLENKVFIEDRPNRAIQSTTIFLTDRVYDFLDSPAEVIVFDSAGGRFILLDVARGVKTELTTGRVATLTERLQQWAGNQSDSFLQFLANPSFEEQFDEEDGQLTFASRWMTYRIETVAAGNDGLSRRYREFSDWYCRLNTALNPGSRPPLGRLKVNAALESRQRIPRRVVLTLRPKPGPLAERITIRSEHRLVRDLTESDRERVARTDRFMATFKPIGFERYQDRIGE